MNHVLWSRINELSEKKPLFFRIKRMVSNWKAVVIISVGALTLKTIAEQAAMLLLRHQ